MRRLAAYPPVPGPWRNHPIPAVPARAERAAGLNLSELFVRRPVMTVVLTASVILFGLLAYFDLPVNDLPAVDYPVIQVSVGDRKSTRLNSSHEWISYAVFCLKKKKNI